MTSLIRVTVLFVAIALVGCIPYYSAPRNVPTATLSVVTDMKDISLERFKDKTCRDYQRDRVIFIQNPLRPNKYHGPATIQAESELVLLINRPFAFPACATPLRFFPESGQTYELHFTSLGRDCDVGLFRVTGETRFREESVVFNDKACLDAVWRGGLAN